MSNLAERLQQTRKSRAVSFPVSVRLRPEVDDLLQQVLGYFPHLTTTQVLNEALHDSLSGLIRIVESRQ